MAYYDIFDFYGSSRVRFFGLRLTPGHFQEFLVPTGIITFLTIQSSFRWPATDWALIDFQELLGLMQVLTF
jgi:hypothetical protein